MLKPALHIAPSTPLAGLRRAANFLTTHSPLLICALFLLAGALLSGDYGLSPDERGRRLNATASLDYILGHITIDDLRPYPDLVFGVSYELPLLLAERALNLDDYYPIHRLRLTLTHLFFIAGAFCCYLLVYRLFNNRLLALLALLLFLLHPRLYAHSFFNSKDLPFLSMFSIALYLLERAWRRDTAGAFVLLGVAVGVLTDLRIMGVMLFPAVLAMRGLDLLGTMARTRRKHILVTAALFALAAGLTPFLLLPYAWSHPLDYLTGALSLTANYPLNITELFQGELIHSVAVPPHYALTWFAITTPPPILMLGSIGAAAVVARCIARPGAVFGNTRLRFGLLLLACFILPLLAVALLDSNIFNGWRHLYFIYAPFCLLAVWGLHWLAAAFTRLRRRPAAIYGLAGAGIALIALQMVQLHPLQHIYFNFLVDRTTPERLRTRYEMGLWSLDSQAALKTLLQRHPGETLTVWAPSRTVGVLPAADRRRLELNSAVNDSDYALVERLYHYHGRHRPDLDFNSDYIHQRLYNNAILNLAALDVSRMTPAAAAAYRELYRQTVSPGNKPLIRAYYDVYLRGRTLTFIREKCQPGDRAAQFGVKIYPARPGQLPGQLAGVSDYQQLYNLAVGLDGRCLVLIRLPDYPIAHILVGQGYADHLDQALWEEGYSFVSPALDDIIAAIRQNPQHHPLRSVFEVFLERGDDNRQRLLYYKPDCSRPEYETPFRLHIYPADPATLSPERQETGFARRDFYLSHYGGWLGGQCFAIVPLPDHPIAAIRTGQADRWDGVLYPAAAPTVSRPADTAWPDDTEPDARAPFNLYLQDIQLTYRREPCAAADTAARFFLHLIPADAADLPPERRPHGFANRDFDFAEWGGRFDSKCVATVPLPDYPIAAIRTGQYIPGQGQLWAAELAVAQ